MSTLQPHESLRDPELQSIPPKRRTLREYGGLVLRGFAMGSADVVPGVSGGTMAFILGIYEELIASLRMLGRPEFFKAVVRLQVVHALKLINLPFLLAVGAGIIIAIVTLAQGIKWALENEPVMIWSFFFGLVLASAFVVRTRIKRWSPAAWTALVIGSVGAFVLVGLVPATTPDDLWFIFLCGALAICAMILPGISGAFILVLLGKYSYILNALLERDLATIITFILGCLIGLVSFAQLLGWLFKRYHDLTVALLIGLMIGSLRKVWPWKEEIAWMTDRHGERVAIDFHNILPPLDGDLVAAVALAIVGFVAVVGLEKLGATDEVSND